jgi:hypothetical protein
MGNWKGYYYITISRAQRFSETFVDARDSEDNARR